MRVIAKRILREFWQKHNDSQQALQSWFKEADKAQWKNPNEIVSQYPTASILNNSRICFNIKGNRYRLIAKVNYDYQMVWIRFIGTHTEYDRIDANKI